MEANQYDFLFGLQHKISQSYQPLPRVSLIHSGSSWALVFLISKASRGSARALFQNKKSKFSNKVTTGNRKSDFKPQRCT
jgi:hypothetical protein